VNSVIMFLQNLVTTNSDCESVIRWAYDMKFVV